MLQRRRVLQFVLSAIASGLFTRKAGAHAAFGDAHAARLTALAGVVLPQEIGANGVARAVDRFMQWIRDYRAGAQMDHGYGFTQLKRAPPSPAIKYPAQLDDLDHRAGGSFTAAASSDRERAVIDAVIASSVTELPVRPDGGHIATDLMAHYFSSPEANDLAYGHLIGRYGCRNLRESEQRPSVLSGATGTQ
jgi:hypothetical protein